MKRIHLDTDLGSDTDDLAALAMLLGWPDVELTGIRRLTKEVVDRTAAWRHTGWSWPAAPTCR